MWSIIIKNSIHFYTEHRTPVHRKRIAIEQPAPTDVSLVAFGYVSFFDSESDCVFLLLKLCLRTHTHIHLRSFSWVFFWLYMYICECVRPGGRVCFCHAPNSRNNWWESATTHPGVNDMTTHILCPYIAAPLELPIKKDQHEKICTWWTHNTQRFDYICKMMTCTKSTKSQRYTYRHCRLN